MVEQSERKVVLKVVIEKTATGYSAYSTKYAIYTTGRDLKVVKSNFKEAAEQYFEDKKHTIEWKLKEQKSS